MAGSTPAIVLRACSMMTKFVMLQATAQGRWLRGDQVCIVTGAVNAHQHRHRLHAAGGVLRDRRAGLNCSPLSSVNGAVEGLTRALALELGPRLRIRDCADMKKPQRTHTDPYREIKAIEPHSGFVDTERFDHMPAEKKQKMLEVSSRQTCRAMPGADLASGDRARPHHCLCSAAARRSVEL
eukprot:3340849-Rhodomonas_salina.2